MMSLSVNEFSSIGNLMTATTLKLGPFDLERVFRAVDKITERMIRAAATLDAAKIPYAVIGGNAVANWVSRVDEAAVRFTKDVDILLRRADLDAATGAMEKQGFVFRRSGAMTMYLDGPTAKARDAVHVLFANERVRQTDLHPAPDVTESEATGRIRVLQLESLVRMKLTSYRTKDQTHLIDMFDIGLIDETWIGRFGGETANRLRDVIEQAKRERLPEDDDPGAKDE